MELDQIIPAKYEKKKKKSGGFQSMNLSYPVLKGILKKGYMVPTPIQRKAIPVVMEGKNVVAMARTGSGKTAAFIIPMLERLKAPIPKSGARALIFSPTRELALQTLRFTRELGKNTELKAISVLGGQKIDDQFSAIHDNPDIIVATPGRFLHIMVEMDLSLKSVEYVVFDEADRLFEMGFQEQLHEVLHRLNRQRQTVLFSATLPKVLVDFVKAGVEEPVLIRLDVESQISANLKTTYLLCRNDDKPAVLLHLLKNVINMATQLTVVFLATKYHVEYIREVLEKADIECGFIYSSLDQMARTIQIAKFKTGKVTVLLVTDIAARGIDIPLLDNVINFNFPAKPKLFVHRVGRVARAGRSGKAFSLVSPDETAFLLDLHLFFGKPIKFAESNMEDDDGVFGSVPQVVIDDDADLLYSWHQKFTELVDSLKFAKNAEKKYLKSRPKPSSESVKRMKELSFASVMHHPMFKVDSAALEKHKMMLEVKKYRPNTTIFEQGPLAKTQASVVMQEKRKTHSKYIKQKTDVEIPQDGAVKAKQTQLEKADEEDLKGFSQFYPGMSNKFRDKDNYLTYVSAEHYQEKGLGIENDFNKQADDAVLDFTDDMTGNNRKHAIHWDRKRKRFFHEDNKEKPGKMKTESGVWISKSYKTDIYKKWKKQNKIRYHDDDNDDEGEDHNARNNKKDNNDGNNKKDHYVGKNKKDNYVGNKDQEDYVGNRRKPKKFNGKQQDPEMNSKRTPMKELKGKQQGTQMKSKRPPKRELKTKEEIMKARKRREKQMNHVMKKHRMRASKGKKKGRK